LIQHRQLQFTVQRIVPHPDWMSAPQIRPMSPIQPHLTNYPSEKPALLKSQHLWNPEVQTQLKKNEDFIQQTRE
jgi:hypothetical protein